MNTLKYMIEAYLNVLMGIATGHIFKGVFIYGKEEPVVLQMNLDGITHEVAIARLMKLKDLFKEGLENMIPFVEVLYKAHKVVDIMDVVIMESLLLKAFDNYQVSNTDPYLLNAYSLGYFKEDGIIERYQEVYRFVVLPLFEVFNGHKF